MDGTVNIGNYIVRLKGVKHFKESNHRYKQKIEKDYILKQLISKQQETKVKQNEKIQEVY
jgi:hypothetical protein